MEGGGLTFSVRFVFALFISESVTVMETLKLGVVVIVVPLIVPVSRPMESPGGNPAAIHEYPTPDPPLACIVNEYSEPCTASGNAFVSIMSACAWPAWENDNTRTSTINAGKSDVLAKIFAHELGMLISSTPSRRGIHQFVNGTTADVVLPSPFVSVTVTAFTVLTSP
jgi:hypothetical protein